MIPVEKGAKIDIHAMRAGFVPGWLELLAAEGTTFPVVKAVDDLDWLIEVKEEYPAVTTIGRMVSQWEGCQNVGEPGANLDQMANQLVGVIQAKLNANPNLKTAVDFWEVCNEPDPPGANGYAQLAKLMILCMTKADAIGIKLGIFALNNGTPEWDEIEAMVATGVFAVAKQGGHIVTVHEGVYNDDPIDKWWGGTIPGSPHVPGAGALCFRYRFIYHLLEQRNEVVPLVVTEFYAGGPHNNGASVLSRVRWYDIEASTDWYHLGVCPFTVSPVGNWGGENYEPAYPTLLDYMIQVKDRQNATSDPGPEPPPSNNLEDHLWVASNAVPHLNLNDALGLWKHIASHGYLPLHTEVPTTFDGRSYTVQQAKQEGNTNRLYVYEPDKELYYLEEGQTPPPTPQFRATSWPKVNLRTTQWFAANPQNYAQFGLPGHDGHDGGAALGEPIKAVAPGTVSQVHNPPGNHNYGIHVRIDHGGGNETVYAHLSQPSVTVGQQVAAGQTIGLAGSTGNSYGVHLHITYKRHGETYTDPAGKVWPHNLHDPWLALEPLYQGYLNQAGITGYVWANSTRKHPHFDWGFGTTNLNLRQSPSTNAPALGLVQSGVPFKITGPKTSSGYYPAVALLGDLPPGTQPPNLIDLRRFKIADPDSWRVVRGVDEDGNQYTEDVQDMELSGGLFVRRKNDNAEWHKRDGSFFYLVHDTSPANGSEGVPRVYTLYKNNTPGAPKSKIVQAIGELWQESGAHHVQFRAKDGCRLLSENSGPAANSSMITAYERNYPFNKYGQNLVLDEVIFEKTGVETQIYARHQGKSLGWIGWSAPWGSSEPVEIHWDRGRLTQEPNRHCSW